MKTITVAGERLTKADQRVLEQCFTRANAGLCTNPTRGERPHYARLARRGLIFHCGSSFGIPFYVPTLHGKGVAAALAAYKAEMRRRNW